MIKDIGALMQDIDIRRALIKEFYGVSMQNPSWIIRGRAGWELLKNDPIQLKGSTQNCGTLRYDNVK